MGLFKNRGWEAIIADDLISNGKKYIDVTFPASGLHANNPPSRA